MRVQTDFKNKACLKYFENQFFRGKIPAFSFKKMSPDWELIYHILTSTLVDWSREWCVLVTKRFKMSAFSSIIRLYLRCFRILLSNHFRVFLHGDCCPAIFIWIVHQNNARRAGKFQFDNPVHFNMLFYTEN